jgi:23S rRNA (pseudouridine1915-N3)-methyltransferase
MRIRVISIGKTNIDFVKEGIEMYEQRIRRYINFEWEELQDVKNSAKLKQPMLKLTEGEAILKRLQPNEFVVLLDEHGKQKSSEHLAEFFQNHFNYSGQNLCFVIGGAYGFSEEMYERANIKLGLSKMTFSHQLVRVILCEQIYRAFTIIRGEPYHHA